MRKFIVISVALLCLGLTACGKPQDEPITSTEEPSPTPAGVIQTYDEFYQSDDYATLGVAGLQNLDGVMNDFYLPYSEAFMHGDNFLSCTRSGLTVTVKYCPQEDLFVLLNEEVSNLIAAYQQDETKVSEPSEVTVLDNGTLMQSFSYQQPIDETTTQQMEATIYIFQQGEDIICLTEVLSVADKTEETDQIRHELSQVYPLVAR